MTMHHSFKNPDFSIAMLGGGQLGKMFLAEARRLDIKINVLDPNPEAPARKGADFFKKGDFKDYDTVINFASGAGAIVIEIESVNVDALEELETRGIPCFPPSRVLRIIQNKGRQKDFFRDHEIPTSDYKKYKKLESLKIDISKGIRSLPFVWKIAEGGYDGFGVKIVRNQKDLDNLAKGECIVESLENIKKEIGVIVARDLNNKITSFPPVQMEFHNDTNQVEFVTCPADISRNLSQKCTEMAISVGQSLKTNGLLAVELFILENDKIVVNELAPRPHNSGHLTIEACNVSQFEQLLRCACQFPLSDIKLHSASVMANIIGRPDFEGPVKYVGLNDALKIDHAKLHLYGKTKTRPHRKMGHVTVIGKSIEEARKKAKEFKSLLLVQSEDL